MKIAEVLLGKYKKRGSSTVFLSLVFSVILILITAVIALLTYRAEKVNIKRTLDISVESVFGKYYAPLFKDYGLFYYIETDMEAIPADVMYYFLENQKDASKLLRLTPENLVISDKKYLISNRDNIKEQMKEAVVSAYGEDIIDECLEAFNIFSEECEDTDVVLDEVIEDTETYEEDAQTEKEILDLIAYVEGVRLSGSEVSVEDCFVKKGVFGDITQAAVGVDSTKIWNALEDNYIDMSELLYDLSEGNDVSKKRLSDWKKQIEDIYEVTENAHTLATELDRKMTDEQKKSTVCDVSKIADGLSDNLSVLNRLLELSEDNMDDKGFVSQLTDMLSGYHISDMYIDYSTYVGDETDDPTDKIDIDPKGITSFLLGDRRISGLAVTESDIYNNMKVSDEENNQFLNYREADELSKVIGNFKCDSITDNIEDMAVTAAYMKKFFRGFLTKDDETVRALNYELEYISSGKESDAENLKAVIHKMLLIRTGQSFVYLLSDSESKQKAYTTAAALVGFSGMDALVRVTQYMILAAWAYADACVDVATILDGGKISIIKKSLNVSFSELMTFSKEMISKKAKEAQTKKGIDYEMMVILFGVLKGDTAVSRCMDIIQFNMKLRDSQRFTFKDAIYGFAAYITCTYPYNMSASSSFSY